ncbi:MAG: RES family NAD+ phosphorylase [Bacteroidia bacterium]
MEVFRISRDLYARSLTASGKEARWNKDNQFVLYTGQSRSLSTLELVVHKNSVSPAFLYEIMVLSVTDDERFYTRLSSADLPANWKSMDAYPTLQDIGSDWYKTNRSLILQVPSVIISNECNYIINLHHPDYSPKTVRLIRNEPFFWDERLLL